jgi:hypothetical protein
LRPTSFGPNDIDNVDKVVEVNFGLLSKKAKRSTRFIFEHLTHAWKIHSRGFHSNSRWNASVPGFKWKQCLGVFILKYTEILATLYNETFPICPFFVHLYLSVPSVEILTINIVQDVFRNHGMIFFFQSSNYHDYIIPCSLREYMPANDKLTELK